MAGVGLSGCGLAEGPVVPGGVVVPQVFTWRLAQVVLTDDRQPAGELAARVPVIGSQMAFAPGASSRLRTVWPAPPPPPVSAPAHP